MRSNRIQLLPEIVANQIAAGEVVNRPSSVVKEMMENAVDAGATSVTVNFRDGGKELIQVVDNGCGLSPIDARMAFDRHATSKITSLEDIYALGTFGFRGEALASIAAVAQVELRTRQQGQEVGTLTTLNGGDFVSQIPAACPEGAQFIVRNLFYNVPARRKFLEKSTTSSNQIKAEFQRVALCHPQVAFELLMNGQPIYKLPLATLAVRIVDVAGRAMKQNLLEVEADTSIVRVTGFVGRPDTARRGSNPSQYLFVNGRYFRSPYFYKAILRAYEKLIPEGCAPSYFLYLTINPARIDVNVHPQKTEVKFADDQAVWQIIHAAVRETLAKTGAVPMMDFDREAGVEIPVMRRGAVYSEPRAMSNEAYNPFVLQEHAQQVEEEYVPSGMGATELDFVPSVPEAVQQRLVAPGNRFEQVVPVGGGYASALYGGRWVVVSLPRARERVRYENYRVLLVNGSSVSQQLLFPEQLLFSADEYALLEENAVEFAALGFDLELGGEGVVEVRGIPAETTLDAIERLIYELLQAMATPLDVLELQRDRLAAAMARNGGGDAGFSAEQATALLEQLVECDHIGSTPSGKTIFAEIKQENILSLLQ